MLPDLRRIAVSKIVGVRFPIIGEEHHSDILRLSFQNVLDQRFQKLAILAKIHQHPSVTGR
jgi:hypothetical protein